MSWFKKNMKVDNVTAVLMVVSVVALLTAAGAMRWAWLLMDEQIMLRKAHNQLQNAQDQLQIQFDFWDEKVTAERKELMKLRAELE